jgi:hypothetical protein
MKRSAVTLLGLLAMVLAGNPAVAHRLEAALSVVEINPSSDTLEITHRLYAHDLEHALELGPVGVGYFETPEGQAAIKTYCERQFFISDGQGKALALQFVGAELSGDLLYVYFEAGRYRGRDLTLDSNLLQDFTEAQVNQVNVRRGGKTVSARFQTGTAAKRIRLP